MGLFSANWEKMSALLAAELEPHLEPGEPLVGVVHANQPKTFSATLYAVGVTPSRLILLPLDKKAKANGAPISITPAQITNSAIWGWGGGVREFLAANSDQQIRFETATDKYKLMVLGGNIIEDALSGETQRRGLDALAEFLIAARG